MEAVLSLGSALLRPLCAVWAPWLQDRHRHTRARAAKAIKGLQFESTVNVQPEEVSDGSMYNIVLSSIQRKDGNTEIFTECC